jgi:broad specificity phosphatase PhoE
MYRTMFHRRIHLVRHGVTVWNRERRFQGHTDVPLSAEGEQQAQITATFLEDFPITACYSSDLARAFETARPIATRLGIQPEPVFELREASKGRLEGKYRDPDTGLIGDESHFHDENDVEARPPGGESMLDLGNRSRSFMARLMSDEGELPPGDIVLVSHGGTMRALLSVLLDLPIPAARSFHFDNCSLTTVTFRGDLPPLLTRYNQIQHLNGLGKE